MTDNEIIKALEVLIKEQSDGYQTALEYGGKRDENQELFLELMESVVAMFNRQKAEIARLNDQIMGMGRVALRMLKPYEVDQATIDGIRYEAIKEFAERLVDEFTTYFPAKREFYRDVIGDAIQEMVGDTR